MRQPWLFAILATGLALILPPALPVASAQEPEKAHEGHAPADQFKKYKAVDLHHKDMEFDLSNAKQKEELVKLIRQGEIRELEGVAPIEPLNVFKYWDLGLWTIVIFVLLLVVLRKMAWGPMLEGLQKREENIRNSVEEAKKARAETERISAEFKVKMDQAYAEIPKIMDQARRDAETFKEEMRTQTAKDIQTERQRLRREIETARDQALQELWNQAAQLATLISAKAIGRFLTEDDHRRLLDEAIVELGQAADRKQ
jgi:F-type H+-transporting ATPase subunit b